MRPGRRSLVVYGLFAAIAVAAVVLAHVLGISVYVITGKSMTGTIPKGSLAVERLIPSSSLRVGDIITFRPPFGDGTITHRITSIESGRDGQRLYRTKGDANATGDPWLFTLDRPEQAKFMFAIPWLGYVLAAFTLPAVRIALLLALALQIIIWMLLWLKEDRAHRQEGCSACDDAGRGSG